MNTFTRFIIPRLFFLLIMKNILNYGSNSIDEFFSVPHICQSGETLSSTQYSTSPGGKGKKKRGRGDLL